MVNYGVSRGCEACKKRHKKCDGARPACTRCIKACRKCPGFKDEGMLIFRHYQPPNPRVELLHYHSGPERSALDIFLSNFVIEASDRHVSRGFLDGIQNLLHSLHPSSPLVQSAELVALASVGKRQEREELLEYTQLRYGSLLKEYQEVLASSKTGVSIEILYTAVCLGLYEIIVSSETHPMQHQAHVRGVCALLQTGVSPIDLNTGVQLFQMGNSLLLKGPVRDETQGVLCSPISHGNLLTLDQILIRFGRLFYQAEDVLAQRNPDLEESAHIEKASLEMDLAFSHWARSQIDIWKPVQRGSLTQEAVSRSHCKFGYAGRVDDYYDCYVAGVWNTYRKSHIMLLNILMRTKLIISEHTSISHLQSRALDLVSDIIASVPYHLTPDVKEYVQQIDAGMEPSTMTAKPVGGLLLLHPLYAASSCNILPRPERLHLAVCLDWIGKNMGIGQAHLLANSVRSSINSGIASSMPSLSLPFQEMSEGHLLIWAGMMLQPT